VSLPAIPRVDLSALFADDDGPARAELRRGVSEVGFLVVHNAPPAFGLDDARVRAVLRLYAAFFALPEGDKVRVDMARTGSNRGWGRPGSERVDPGANPDYKEFFDTGFAVPGSDLAVHAPNLWPDQPLGFQDGVEAYFTDARALALRLLRAVAEILGRDPDWFDTRFSRPMALLRGNFYPPRPAWAGPRDHGIAAHTDYGCLTLLATDGTPGLEVQGRDGTWIPLSAPPGEFVINFGEMLEIWSAGQVRATPHRVIGGAEARLSVPLFFNPDPETDVAPPGARKPVRALDHMNRRFGETYLHLGGLAG
jgi:isopenicillin N synthase-like dioxygenase